MNGNKNINNRLVIGLLIILIILFFSIKQNKPFQSFFNTAARPFTRFFSGSGYWFSKKISFISNIGELRSENENLFNENLKLKFDLVQLIEIRNENKILREEIDLNAKNIFETEASLVIGQTLSKNRKIIYLDKGSRDGVEEGMPIIVGKGVLIGKISKVYYSTSEAELVLDRDNKINAEIQSSQAKGIVQGEYGTSAAMDMIPQATNVEIGQTVITSGLGGTYPRGLLIGYVKDVGVTVDQLFQKATLDLPVQFINLRMIWIIKNSK